MATITLDTIHPALQALQSTTDARQKGKCIVHFAVLIFVQFSLSFVLILLRSGQCHKKEEEQGDGG